MIPALNNGSLVICLKIVLSWVDCLLPCLVIATVFFELDPLSQILRVYPTFGIGNISLFLFRVVFILGVANAGAVAAFVSMLVGTMVVCSTTDLIRRLSKRKERLNKLDARIVGIYRELQIWIGYFNQNFCYLAVPQLIFFGVFFIILGTYGTIRMFGRISWIIYPVFPVCSLTIFVFFVTFVSKSAMIFECSNDYLRQLSQNVSSKHDRRLVKSFKPLRIQIGPFGRVDKGFCTEVLTYFTENTSSLLITF